MQLPVSKLYEEHHFGETRIHTLSFLSPYDTLVDIVKHNSFQIINGLDVSAHTPNILSDVPQLKKGGKVVLSKQVLSPGTDGYIFSNLTDTLHQSALLLRTADCAPITFTTKKGEIMGIVHIGWKGLISDIIQNLVQEIVSLGLHPKNIQLWIGPMAGAGFEFGEKDYTTKIQPFLDKNSIKRFPTQKMKEGTISFDFRALVIRSLTAHGFLKKNIAFSQRNTLDSSEDLPSWRKRNNQRIVTMIYN